MADRPTGALPDWERLLAAERHLQALVPGTVMVGGTAAALHGRHRQSLDADHVLADLEARRLPSGGRLDGILTGIRHLRRAAPLETEEIEGLRVLTLAEMGRIKAWLFATRATTRDYLDTVVLLERLGESGARGALARLDEIYRQPNGASVLAEVVERLGEAKPTDRSRVDLATYRGLVPPWNEWGHLAARGRAWARILADALLGRSEGSTG